MRSTLAMVACVLMIGLAACSPESNEPAQTPEPEQTAAPVPQGPMLVSNGASAYQIVLSEGASPSETTAANELQKQFEACAGVKLPIVPAFAKDGPPSIVLGCGVAAESLGVTPGADALGEQGYLMKTVAPHLVIAGTPAAGTMYGVFDLLEQHLGVRWYAPGVTKTPAAANLPLPDVDTLKKPTFAWRYSSYTRPGRDGLFTAQQRDNNGSGGPDHEFGTQYHFDSRCHSYFRYITVGEFFEEHPEYFSEIGGVRRKKETQLCLTNPEVLDIVTERMLKRMADSPHVRQHNFSQMDYYNVCECANCRAMNEQYGTDGGTQFWFCNQLAERTTKQFPNKLIGTLAYMYTEEPPKDLEIHPNVAIWLCHMYPSCDSHPVATCELNADYKRRAVAWSKLCSHLYMWHYFVDFAHYYNPFPNFRAMAADIRFYRDIGVEGIYLQGMSARGGGGEFSLLRPYLGMQLLWNPDADANAVIKDFLEGYYGPAWEPIWQYITMIHDKVEDEHIHMHLYTNPGQGYLPDEVMAKANELFDQAEAAVAGDDTLLERVRVARMPLTYAKLFPRNGYVIENGLLKFQGEIASVDEIGAFLARMKDHGFTSVREAGGAPEQLSMWALGFGMPLPLVTVENDFLIAQAAPFIGGRVLRITDKASGECITAHNTKRSMFFPLCGGEESRVGGQFITHMHGSMELYQPVQDLMTKTSGTLETKAGGYTIRRTFTLAPDAPVLTITTDVTNDSDKPKDTTVRSHLEYDLGTVADTRVAFTDRTGAAVEKDMRPIIAGLREGEHYYDENAPKGSWTFTGTKGLKVVQRFDDAQVDFAWLYAYPEYLNDLEAEVWMKKTILQPGESTSMSIQLEVLSAQ
ncbi:MAG: DUF4838 domain-containing protein [bacterium]|nr:DUF4838 domain-containing protein [bacterium]